MTAAAAALHLIALQRRWTGSRRPVGFAPGEPGRLEVDLVRELLHAVVAERDRLGVEGVRLEQLGARTGDLVTLSGPLGAIDLPIGVADLAPGTVWAPASTPGAPVRHLVGPAGSSVAITTIVGGAR